MVLSAIYVTAQGFKRNVFPKPNGNQPLRIKALPDNKIYLLRDGVVFDGKNPGNLTGKERYLKRSGNDLLLVEKGKLVLVIDDFYIQPNASLHGNNWRYTKSAKLQEENDTITIATATEAPLTSTSATKAALSDDTLKNSKVLAQTQKIATAAEESTSNWWLGLGLGGGALGVLALGSSQDESATGSNTSNTNTNTVSGSGARASVTAISDDAGSTQGAVAQGAVTDDSNLILSGTLTSVLAAGETVRIYDGTRLLGTATVTGTSWTYTDTRTLSHNQVVSFTARVVAANGNEGTASVAYTATVDTAAPVGLTIGVVAGDDVIDITEQGSVIRGAKEAGAGVNVVLGGNTRTLGADATTAWSYTLVAADITAMGQGAETITATQIDSAGNTQTETRTISVNTTVATVSGVAVTSATGILSNTLSLGDVVTATVTMSETVTVTGTPQLALNIGGTTVQANYASGSGSNSLTFTYTITAGQTDANGIALAANALNLNGGTIANAAGNAATLTHAAVVDNANFLVSAVAPNVPIVKTAAAGANGVSAAELAAGAAIVEVAGDTGNQIQVTFGVTGSSNTIVKTVTGTGVGTTVGVALTTAEWNSLGAVSGSQLLVQSVVTTDAVGNSVSGYNHGATLNLTDTAGLSLNLNNARTVTVNGQEGLYYFNDQNGDGTVNLSDTVTIGAVRNLLAAGGIVGGTTSADSTTTVGNGVDNDFSVIVDGYTLVIPGLADFRNGNLGGASAGVPGDARFITGLDQGTSYVARRIDGAGEQFLNTVTPSASVFRIAGISLNVDTVAPNVPVVRTTAAGSNGVTAAELLAETAILEVEGDAGDQIQVTFGVSGNSNTIVKTVTAAGIGTALGVGLTTVEWNSLGAASGSRLLMQSVVTIDAAGNSVSGYNHGATLNLTDTAGLSLNLNNARTVTVSGQEGLYYFNDENSDGTVNLSDIVALGAVRNLLAAGRSIGGTVSAGSTTTVGNGVDDDFSVIVDGYTLVIPGLADFRNGNLGGASAGVPGDTRFITGFDQGTSYISRRIDGTVEQFLNPITNSASAFRIAGISFNVGPAVRQVLGMTLDLQTASDLGTNKTDDTTADTTPTFDVTGLTGATLQVGDVIELVDTSNGNAVVASHTVVTADLTAGVWSAGTLALTTSALSVSAHAIAVRVSDAAGVVGAIQGSLTVTIDTTSTATPLILDLNGDGVQTTDIAAGVTFDLFGDGTSVYTGWSDGIDGLLALDLNQDGQINSGAELFGSGTLVNGVRASDGYQALGQYDSNNDQVIDATDAVYQDLRLWVDRNVDGVSQADELHSLLDLGVQSLDLKAQQVNQSSNGNAILLQSSWTDQTGQTHELADVWFEYEAIPVDASAAPASAIDGTLNSQAYLTPEPVFIAPPTVQPVL